MWACSATASTFILDQTGVIRAKLFYEGYQKRHGSADIISAAKVMK